MTKHIFNPDDFVFEKLPIPEDNPTLIEYDAIARLIHVRIKDFAKNEHEYNSVFLTKEVNKKLQESFPDKWSNENDRIIYFSIREDGKYTLEKEKLKYDFDKKETKWVRYEYKNLSLNDVAEIFDILKGIVYVQNLRNEEERNEQLLSLAKRDVYVDEQYKIKKSTCDKLIRETDWRILPDAPQSFEGEMDLWVAWRAKLRTMIKRPEDFDDIVDYLIWNEEFKWPINPERYHEIYPEHDVEYLSTEDQYTLSDVSITDEKLQLISDELNRMVKKLKHDKEVGIPIPKSMLDIIRRYSLIDGIENIKINDQGELQ